MSFSSEPLVAEVQQTAGNDLTAGTESIPPQPVTVIPSIQYHRTLYLNAEGRPSPNNVPTGIAVHDVISVPDEQCSLASVLHLLPYRIEDVFVCLGPGQILCDTALIRKLLSSRRKLPFASLLVAHRGQLHGVQVENGVAKIVGTVRQMITSLEVLTEEEIQTMLKKGKEEKEEDEKEGKFCLVLDGTATGQVVALDNVTFDPARHTLVTVPLGGYCFAQLKGAGADESEADEEGESTASLVLLVGVSFLLFTSEPQAKCALKWNAYVDSSMKEVVCKSVQPGSTFFQYSGGWIVQQQNSEESSGSSGGSVPSPTYLMTGAGLRKCPFMEAYFYAQMHVKQTVKQMEEIEKDK